MVRLDANLSETGKKYVIKGGEKKLIPIFCPGCVYKLLDQRIRPIKYSKVPANRSKLVNGKHFKITFNKPDTCNGTPIRNEVKQCLSESMSTISKCTNKRCIY